MSSEVEDNPTKLQGVTLPDNGCVPLQKRRQVRHGESVQWPRNHSGHSIRLRERYGGREARYRARQLRKSCELKQAWKRRQFCCVNHLVAELPFTRLDLVQLFGR